MKIGPALDRGRRALRSQSETPGLDAQVLLADILDRNRAWVLAHPEADLTERQRRRYVTALQDCLEGRALAYVLGWWEFYGRRFRVTPQVLIPRPETELMVEQALEIAHGRSNKLLHAIDVGTGSGCVAVTLAAEAENVKLIAADVDRAALSVARVNTERHSVVDRIRFVCTDLMRGFKGPFDLICANLPYIPTAELGRLRVGEREPRRALDGGVDGLAVVRRLIDMLPGKMNRETTVLIEIGDGQGESVTGYLRERFGFVKVQVHRDLAGRERLVQMERGRGG
jgi:release factor glutamine methyltransferase